ncbi:hypothetical protein Stsp02_08550 [Streptomyces sp. NBRC 14336]|nr:hypothetical protein Stsp02_08550 [Streptomyces sp. NBRC 14336]
MKPGGGRIRRPPDRPGTYARAHVRNKYRIHIFTDLIFVQEVCGGLRFAYAKGQLADRERVSARFGVPPAGVPA